MYSTPHWVINYGLDRPTRTRLELSTRRPCSKNQYTFLWCRCCWRDGGPGGWVPARSAPRGRRVSHARCSCARYLVGVTHAYSSAGPGVVWQGVQACSLRRWRASSLDRAVGELDGAHRRPPARGKRFGRNRNSMASSVCRRQRAKAHDAHAVGVCHEEHEGSEGYIQTAEGLRAPAVRLGNGTAHRRPSAHQSCAAAQPAGVLGMSAARALPARGSSCARAAAPPIGDEPCERGVQAARRSVVLPQASSCTS